MVRLLAALVATLLGACQQIPPAAESPTLPVQSSARVMQSSAAGASAERRAHPYGAAVVRDLVIADIPPENLTGVDLANFEAVRGELARRFGATFRETLRREGYVRVALTGESAADVVIIQPATMRISPGYNVGGVEGVSPTELEIAIAVREPSGRLIGLYAVQYTGAVRHTTAPIARTDLLRSVFTDAGEQVARAIAKSR